MTEFLQRKYGFFVHYVWGGEKKGAMSVDRAGKQAESFDAFADAFDVDRFADDLESWGVEYVIFTAWHYNINPLFPSETMKRWGLEKHRCKRDLIREVITACTAKGIRVMLYTHPRDGHDLGPEDQIKTGWGGPNGVDPQWENFDRKKWNDFTCELYEELITRYGNDIIGIFSDEGSAAGDSFRVVDYPRLRRTVKSLQPDLMMEQNWYGTTYSLDVGCKEYAFWGEFASHDGNAWPAWRMPVATMFAPSWYATRPAGQTVTVYKAEDMFSYTVLQAGANHEGGGVQWAAGNYAGGGWETGVEETMDRVAALIQPIAPSIKKVHASNSWPTTQGTKIPDLRWGGVATRSIDDKIEYLHILTPPADGSKSLTLPAPADGKRFSKAVLLKSRQAVNLKQDAQGLRLELAASQAWDPLDTVIALQVAADSPPQNLALWKAFRGSSFPDPGPSGASAYAFAAVDGDTSTRWSSRPTGATEGNEAVPTDDQPSCQIDLGLPAKLTRIEVLGAVGPDVVLSLSASSDFKKAKRVASSKATPPPSLVIHRATYGTGDQVADLTDFARKSISNGILNLKAGNELTTTDPAPGKLKELRVEFSLDGKDSIKVVPEGGSLDLGGAVWALDLPAGTSARFVRLERSRSGPPLSVAELRVFGTFE